MEINLLLLSFLLAVQATDKDANDTSEPASEDVGGVGLLDVVVLGGLGVLAYLYWRRKSAAAAEDATDGYVIQSSALPSKDDGGDGSGSSGDKGFIGKMKKSRRRLILFYGSQTGTAEEYASRLAKEGQMYGLRGLVSDPEECDMEDLIRLKEVDEALQGECLAVFSLATYGEGDPTDNAQEFFDWLQAGSGDLSGMKYAVFGLGNKTYEHYNKMAIYVDKRLEELGASRIHELGLGDDDANLEEDFITWKESFWVSVCAEFGLEASDDDINMRQYEQLVFKDGEYDPERIFTGEVARVRSYAVQRPPYDAKNPFLAPVAVNRNLFSPQSDRHCMHIELDISESRLRYETGDHVAVFPQNNRRLVDRIAELLRVDDLDAVFTMRATDEDATKVNPFPCPTTYRTALTYYVDVAAIPRTHVLKGLADHTEDPKEKEMLRLMGCTTPEGKELYSRWIVDDCRHVGQILEDLPSCKPPADLVMELLPRLQARFYSISSSPKLYKESVHVTAILVRYQTPTGRTNRGVATSWMKRMVPGPDDEGEHRVPIYLRRSQFRLPNKHSAPVVMIGPGTGVAPFRGFIQERAWLRREGKEVGPTHLFFGCRHRNTDYIYREELEGYEEEGALVVHAAFSRDQPEKRYVTHLLREQGELVWRLLGEEAGYLYVCGDAKAMAKDVVSVIKEVIVRHGGAEDGGEEFMKKMEQQKRYSADVWS